ncbi:MAG: lipid A deacylase LpxR family protein [Vibrionaceae bacterium]
MAIKQHAKQPSRTTARCTRQHLLKTVLPYCGILIASLLSSAAYCGTIEISADNDSLSGKDREYSSGIFLRWSDSFTASHAHQGYSIIIGSQIWTPSDIAQPKPMPNERPYAGLFYLQGGLFWQNENTAYKGDIMLGTAGPRSHAYSGQKAVHALIGSKKPQGWDYQIFDQSVAQGSLEIHRAIWRSDWQELSFIARGQAGNFQNEVATGINYRLGIDLVNSFGAVSSTAGNHLHSGMLANSRNGLFFIAGIEGRYRFTDLTIEGDKPTQNAQLQIKNQQIAGIYGLVYYQNAWGLSLIYNHSSKTYVSPQAIAHNYGHINYFYRF